jgi:hypothetical protein
MSKIKLYIPGALHDAPLSTWFAPLPTGQLFVEGLPPNFFETSVEQVQNPEEAVAIVLQNSFRSLDENARAYIKQYADLGEQLGKPVFVFSLGDFTDQLPFDERVYVMRFSVYRGSMRKRDVVIPTTAELQPPVTLRAKQATPVVGFCGKGAFSGMRSWAGYVLKELLKPKTARTIGVYWRRAMMRSCTNSSEVSSNFIVRSNFSGIKKTIELDPATARKEFLQNIIDSDFVLAPKGDGNYSNRFLETLSLGRIPVVVDTDIVLPFEDKIDYENIMVRVPMQDVKNTPRYIREFYDALSNEEWRARQELARATFENYLRQDKFFEHYFANLLTYLK